MDEPFAIKISVGDGRYSAGGSTIKASRYGKAWTSRGALKNHLRMTAKRGVPGGLYQGRYGDDCDVAEMLGGEGISFYGLDEWIKTFMDGGDG